MKPLACALILLSVTSAAHADDTIAPDRIIDAAVGDWNKDGKPDLALLALAPPDDETTIGIYIYLRDKEHQLLKLAAAAPDKVWGRGEPGGIFGQEPSITALPNGSIAVMSQNDAIGRDRWHQTLTLAFRNNAFVVAGYTFDYRDNLEADRSYSCDYNVLTGKATKSGRELQTQAKTIKIQDWKDDIGRKVCGENT
ncbi:MULTISPECIES: hypothetical protein [unclassified Rhizobium]|uniref:hypothetical protein n=1 Tax=unclassified Rhizobium TaxID=2613769 RepID=UPI000CDF4396|nr:MULTISPECIES: hypothetical protein [Rhizobium]AVA21132.1 hypothetical protein NXC24_CH01473 [Rhizobium sp. NXC24]MDK4739273.1 hypothetical protein [Rhizobium sp. CNPSo 3464]UWU22322.1 hypothetical protein N2601_04945 [Rhizobium tropici]